MKTPKPPLMMAEAEAEFFAGEIVKYLVLKAVEKQEIEFLVVDDIRDELGLTQAEFEAGIAYAHKLDIIRLKYPQSRGGES